MSEYAPITERLRGSFKNLPFISEREEWVGIPKAVLEQECCTIDTAYKALEVVAVSTEVWGGIPMPLDADGETIGIGDRMASSDGMAFTVDSIDYGHHPTKGDGVTWVVWGDNAEVYELATDCIHLKEQSVEDVLREFAFRWGEAYDENAFVSEYAAKLRLASDA